MRGKALPCPRRCSAPPQPALPGLPSSYWLMRRTKTLHPALLCAPPGGLCRLLRAPAGRWSFPTLSPQSLCRRLDPYPVDLHRCNCLLLPDRHRPRLRFHRLGARKRPTTRLHCGSSFRGCSHSLMFRLPHWLGPLTAPTAEELRPTGRLGRLHHAMKGRLPNPSCGIATCVKQAIHMAELPSAGLWTCLPLQEPRNPGTKQSQYNCPSRRPHPWSLRFPVSALAP